MNPLLVNTYDKGGAAKACIRLHEKILQKGVNSKLLVKKQINQDIPESYIYNSPPPPPPLPLTIKIRAKNKLLRLLREFWLYPKEKIVVEEEVLLKQKFLYKRDSRLERFSFPKSGIDITTFELYKEAEIINLHWVAGFIDYQSFFEKNTKPVIWTLHDMNPFTGGEHYIEQYIGMDMNGHPLLRSLSMEEESFFKRNIEIKKKALSKITNLTIVTPSVWLANEARKSELFNQFPIHIIPYGLNSDIFKPRDKIYSRSLLNISLNKKVILFVADSISNERKGIKYLYKAFEHIPSDTILISIGTCNNSFYKNSNYIELGKVEDELLMSIIYSSADVFVITSLMDNFPNTVLESLMCGVPVIGFPSGGIPEMIVDGFNGYICPEISVEALLFTLKKFLTNHHQFNQQNIRNYAVLKYDQDIQATKYINLFNKILQ